MGTGPRHRLLTAALWGIALLTLAVCGLGLRLTVHQYRQARDALLATEKRSAEQRLARVLSFLEESERDALETTAAAGLDAWPEHPFLREPFLIRRDGTLLAPALSRRSRDLAAAADPLPEEIERTLAFALSSATSSPGAEGSSASSSLATLAALRETTTYPEPARLRAAVGLAALALRRGDGRAAAAEYRRAAQDFAGALAGPGSPTRRHLALAEAEALEASGDRQGALRALASGMFAGSEAAGGGGSPAPIDEEELFLRRAARIFERGGEAPPQWLTEARRDLDRRRLLLADTLNLRDWITDRARLERGLPDAGEPQHTVTPFGSRLVPTVWISRAAEQGDDERPKDGELLAVGCRIDVEALVRELDQQLRAASEREPLRVVATDREGSDGVEVLATFPGPLRFLSLGIDRERWESLVGRHQDPFLFAGALVALLGVALLASLVVIHRAVAKDQALARMKTEFVANVSHELKTPLALIRLCGETLLLRRVRHEEQKTDYLRIITRESVRLSHLLSNVLDFSSIEAGRKVYTLEPTDLGRVVRETLESYRFQLEEKGFECLEEVAEPLPPVRADAEAVAQALINLLQNAVRYSPDRKRIEVRCLAQDAKVRLSVRDYGSGIEREEQEKVWEDYYRTRGARALGTRGSGLGLSLVRHIARAHGAKVELESEPGKGSTFTLVFPAAREEGRNVDESERDDPRDRG